MENAANWPECPFDLCKNFVPDGVIRVGGRLQRPNLLVKFKHLIVLPKRHRITGLIINDVHGAGKHLASQYVANKLRQRYHILGQGRTVKFYIKTTCMTCRNCKAVTGA